MNFVVNVFKYLFHYILMMFIMGAIIEIFKINGGILECINNLKFIKGLIIFTSVYFGAVIYYYIFRGTIMMKAVINILKIIGIIILTLLGLFLILFGINLRNIYKGN